MKLTMNVINLYQCDKGFRTPKRIFDYHYLLYVHSGKGQYVVAGKTYQASMGDIFYVPPFVENTIIADQEEPFLLSGIEFESKTLAAGDNAVLEGMNSKSNILKNGFLIETINQMVKEYLSGHMYSRQICSSLLDSLVLLLLQGQVLGDMGQEQMKRQMLDYVMEHIQTGVSHQNLSDIFSCHKSTINRIMISSTGLSLKNYLLDLRIKKASELLKYSSKSMSEVAELCGYQSSIFFSKQFRQKTGMTPTQFRNNSQKASILQSENNA